MYYLVMGVVSGLIVGLAIEWAVDWSAFRRRKIDRGKQRTVQGDQNDNGTSHAADDESAAQG